MNGMNDCFENFTVPSKPGEAVFFAAFYLTVIFVLIVRVSV